MKKNKSIPTVGIITDPDLLPEHLRWVAHQNAAIVETNRRIEADGQAIIERGRAASAARIRELLSPPT
jgi:hypothetical protein